MPEIHSRTLHSFSSEDSQFPAKNLLETKVTKKWKCSIVGEKSCFVVLKLDQPRVISGIDIGNERSGFIEVLVGNSKQDPPAYKEILLATSFMTIIEAKNGNNPNRVRCFTNNILVESVAKQKWDLIKVICTQPFNSKIQYGLSFITLHTPEEEKNDNSPVKPVLVAKAAKAEDSSEKKSKFGKFAMRADSGSDDDKKDKVTTTPFNRWKSSKTGSENKVSIKDQMKAKIEENRKRIRVVPDSSDEDPKPTPKPNRNRTSGLVYEDEDDEPNERLQKKIDKDKERKEKDQKTPKLAKRDKSPPRSDSKRSKFSSFIDVDEPSTSSRHRSPSRSSSKPSFSSSSSSKKSQMKSPRKDKEPEKKSNSSPLKASVTYKPFHKLLEGVVFAFSGYVNPERGILRQKALDMGAKYRPDWDSSCSHLICAFASTPKYQQVKGKGKIVTKRWIDACFTEQKKIPWRRYALDDDSKDEPESEEEIHNILSKKSDTPTKRKRSESESDDDMVVVDKRVKNGDDKKAEDEEPVVIKDDESVVVETSTSSQNVMEVSTDDELMSKSNNGSTLDLTQVQKPVYKDKIFYLNEDLPATDVIKLKNQISELMGKITERSSKANYIITENGRKLPHGAPGEVLIKTWVYECYELEAFIPTTRYKPKTLI